MASLAWHDDHAEANGWSYQLNSLREVRGASEWWVLVRPPGSDRYIDPTFLDPPLSALREALRAKEGSKSWAKRTAEQHADEVAERLRSSRPRGRSPREGVRRQEGLVADEGAFVPAGFDPPPGLAAGGFRLEPLGPQHNERDYAAWTSSMDHIHRSPGYAGRSWPHEMSPAENLADLERHAHEFVERSGFTYTVLDETDDVVGCLYIYPCEDGVHDAIVLSWVRESRALEDGDLRRVVAEWLTSDAWPFARPLYEPLLP